MSRCINSPTMKPPRDKSCTPANTLEPHYNAHFGVHSDISVVTEQPYNEGLIHRKYKQWAIWCYKQISAIKEGVIMRFQCIKYCSMLIFQYYCPGHDELRACLYPCRKRCEDYTSVITRLQTCSVLRPHHMCKCIICIKRSIDFFYLLETFITRTLLTEVINRKCPARQCPLQKWTEALQLKLIWKCLNCPHTL